MERFYYQFLASSPLGKKFFKFHHQCVNADEAAENYARKMGAKAWYSDPNAFAGGVNCLEFDEQKVDKQMWRPVDVIEGRQCYEPAVSVVAGAVMIDDKERFRPSDTRIRTYAKQPCRWEQVRQFYTMRQWAAMIGYQLTGNKEADGQAIIDRMKNQKFLQFMEFYGEQRPSRPKENKIARAFRRAVRAEQQRMRLPVVPVQALYDLLHGVSPVCSDTIATENENPSTPTFFLFGETYYVSVSRPCQHQDLQAITKEIFVYKANMLKLQIKRQEKPS